MRHIEFEACFNFRDVGGYATLDGRRVRTGLVFRSDTLHRLTDADLDVAGALGLATVIDLRSTQELETEGRYANAHEVAFHHVPVFEQDALPFEPATRDTPAPPPGEDYVAIATTGRDAIAITFEVLSRAKFAAVFHCAAGKDRTGIVAALLLSTLGVPEDDIVADYTLSTRARAAAMAWAETNDPALAQEFVELPPWLLDSSPEVMRAFLDQLVDRHGSIEQYLLDAGVARRSLDALRDRLLQAV
jgi:protein-tyrosine phosphatase